MRYHTNPKEIFGIPDQPNTSVEICMDQWVIPKSTKYTKCNWTPFENMQVTGRVIKTTLRDNLMYHIIYQMVPQIYMITTKE